eukprot:TRINITY_DN31342_c0_g1_i1.p1 TRINITY_DN31342_c0_g1~~TRINITY_DN31342_c0_g1_i1.p1  ORF type:complete len:512 (+),score=92.80 TRINITY_DN31342_c0_g1_i1:60-1538(+)
MNKRKISVITQQQKQPDEEGEEDEKRPRKSKAGWCFMGTDVEEEDDYNPENHVGDGYGEISYKYGSDYLALEKDSITLEGVARADAEKYKIAAPGSDGCSEDTDSDNGSLDGYMDAFFASEKRNRTLERSNICPLLCRHGKTTDRFSSLRAGVDSSCCAINEHQAIFYGGRKTLDDEAGTSNLLKWCEQNRTFSKITCIPFEMPPRYGHAAVCNGTQLHIFGGRHNKKTLKDLWTLTQMPSGEYHVKEVKPVSGRSPVGSYHSSMVLHNSKLVLFGGISPQGASTDSLITFNTTENTWEHLKLQGGTPKPRHGHTACVVEQSMYVFGGMGSDDTVPDRKEYFNDLFKMDFEGMVWTQIHFANGVPPSPRCFHSSFSHGGLLYVFGGVTVEILTGSPLLLHVYSPQSDTWLPPKTYPLISPHLSRHTSVVFHSAVLTQGVDRLTGAAFLYLTPLSTTLKDLCAVFVLQNALQYSVKKDTTQTRVVRRRPNRRC